MAAMDDGARTRGELMAGYEHPYRRWIPVAWDYEHAPRTVVIAAAACVAAAVADRIDGPDPIPLTVALLAGAGVLAWVAWVTLNAALIVHSRIRDWEDSEDELAEVRRRRPHAGDADPVISHDEYAVAVGDDADLVTWRFRPLPAHVDLPAGAVLITGRPRYAATPALDRQYDAVDTARAAEQLAEAQQEAAALEQEAITRAVRGLEEATTARELEAEARGTGAALRRITGQAER